jgi:hypothetical protein
MSAEKSTKEGNTPPWCTQDDYEFRGNAPRDPNTPIPRHRHIDKYKVQYEDGTITGYITESQEE